jgi:hypothetical protein
MIHLELNTDSTLMEKIGLVDTFQDLFRELELD